MVCRTARSQDFAHSTSVSPLSIIPPMLRTQSLIFYRRCVRSAVDSVVKQRTSLSLSPQPHAADIGHEQRAEWRKWKWFVLYVSRQLAAPPVGCQCGLTAVRCNPDTSLFRRLLSTVTATTRHRDRASSEGFQNVPYAANLTWITVKYPVRTAQ